MKTKSAADLYFEKTFLFRNKFLIISNIYRSSLAPPRYRNIYLYVLLKIKITFAKQNHNIYGPLDSKKTFFNQKLFAKLG